MKKVKETTKLIKHINGAEKREEYFAIDDINKTLGKINSEIQLYRHNYYKMPQFIVISKELELLLQSQMEIMNERQTVIINNNTMEIRIIFGISCFISPVLTGLEFEVR